MRSVGCLKLDAYVQAPRQVQFQPPELSSKFWEEVQRPQDNPVGPTENLPSDNSNLGFRRQQLWIDQSPVGS